MIPCTRIQALRIPILLTAWLGLFLLPNESHGQEITEILRQISEEKSGKTTEKKNTTAETEKSAQKKSEPKKSKPAKPTAQAVQSPTAPAPRLILYGPKDKLPNNLAGCAVVGDFMLIGEDLNGGAKLVPFSDANLLFPRQFIVKNLRSRYTPGTILYPSQYRKIRVPRERPLLFIGRDGVPGHYLVRDSLLGRNVGFIE
jgi:hypothetical protein